uniref:F5/8 type C domain-containing protein n=1 Tax=Mesocestoides corti TaxID=53468 RepID=A0A5K3ERH4_MESCO
MHTRKKNKHRYVCTVILFVRLVRERVLMSVSGTCLFWMLRYATGQEFVLWSQYLLISVVSVDATLLHEMDNTANSFLTPSSYSASSALDNYGANQASGSVFDSKGDDNPRAWCPQSPIQDDRREWLQLDFDGLKVIKLLITWGLSSKPAHFVPYFLLLYQRHDGRWHQFTSHNGTQLIVANQDNSQPKTITLSPPITARRLRIVPYRGDHAQLMCLKLSVLGHAFEASILSYEIPEGDIYRSPAGGVTWAALNDSSYDGNRSPKRTSLLAGGSHRGLLAGGLGVLVDGRIYAGGEIRRALEAPFSLRNMPRDSRQTLSGLVGWFCRSGLPPSLLSPPCQSRNVSLLFAFESVRHFTELRIHALNSFSENIAVFREALVQFSVGGRLFDRYGPPVLYEYQRNVTSSQPTWVVIPLNGRVGRFVRLILTFDSDWIILSEVAFNSTLLTANIDEEEKGVLSQSPITPLPSPKLFGDSCAPNKRNCAVSAFQTEGNAVLSPVLVSSWANLVLKELGHQTERRTNR